MRAGLGWSVVAVGATSIAFGAGLVSGGGSAEDEDPIAAVRETLRGHAAAYGRRDGRGWCARLTPRARRALDRYARAASPRSSRGTCASYVRSYARSDGNYFGFVDRPTTPVRVRGDRAVAKLGTTDLRLAHEDGEWRIAVDERDGFRFHSAASQACIARTEEGLARRLPSADRKLVREYFLRSARATVRLREAVRRHRAKRGDGDERARALRYLRQEIQAARTLAEKLKSGGDLGTGGIRRGPGNRLLRLSRRSIRSLDRLGVRCRRLEAPARLGDSDTFASKAFTACAAIERRFKRLRTRLVANPSTPAALRTNLTVHSDALKRASRTVARLRAPPGAAAALRRARGTYKELLPHIATLIAAIDRLDQAGFNAAAAKYELAAIRVQIGWTQLGLVPCANAG